MPQLSADKWDALSTHHVLAFIMLDQELQET
jgi:hypothetical protein